MITAVARRRPRVPLSACSAGVAVAATAVFLLVSRALIDDAYITMAYARNLGLHLHWGLIADETANSATSPLNVVALGAITAVVRDAQVAVGVLFVVSAVLAARWLAGLAEDCGARARFRSSRWGCCWSTRCCCRRSGWSPTSPPRSSRACCATARPGGAGRSAWSRASSCSRGRTWRSS